ncbi:MAG: hypothetical protein K2X01_10095 [Cyanobacteria bacterium]|nr:hypothetical protein [Cyanobacteriota bacterium]
MQMFNEGDPDLWGRLAIGRMIWESHGQILPFVDTFSYTAYGAKWIDHEWGSSVFLYGLWQSLGPGSILIAKFVFFALTAGLNLWTAGVVANAYLSQKVDEMSAESSDMRPSWTLASVIVMVLYICLIPTGWLVSSRCHIFSFFGFSLFLALANGYFWQKLSRTWLWLTPCWMLFWVNLHGGFLMGFIVLGVFGLRSAITRQWDKCYAFFVVLIICLAVTILNPYGFSFYPHMVYSWLLNRPLITEWQSLPNFSPDYTLFFLACSFITVVLGAWGWRRDRLSPDSNRITQHPRQPLAQQLIFSAFVFGLFGVAAWMHVKLIPFFGQIWLIETMGLLFWVRPGQGNSALPTSPHSRSSHLYSNFYRWLLPLGVSLGLFIITVSSDTLKPQHFPSQRKYPEKAMDWLAQQHATGNIFCHFDWGEYILWRGYPALRVSIDGRFEELYSVPMTESMYRFYRALENRDGDAHSARQILTQFPTTQWVIIPESIHKKLSRAQNKIVFPDSQWALVYQDSVASVYQHKHWG